MFLGGLDGHKEMVWTLRKSQETKDEISRKNVKNLCFRKLQLWVLLLNLELLSLKKLDNTGFLTHAFFQST